ncbi:hypothetical protein SAMN05880582_105236 [Rhizobium sp. RU20A]|nr:hypothetical protein SAMN05880582_105236 [Rhizobium sp. RU20A]
MPSNGLAWVVRAQSALVRGDIDGFLSDLKLSQRVTPNEAAKARLRVILAEANMALLDEPARQAHISDIRMLAGTTEGMRWIAQRYLANPEYRETIVQVIESLPDERQRRFLGELKNSPST